MRPKLNSTAIEPLEARIALSATPLAVARALDLLDGTTVVLSGDPLSFGTQTLGVTGQLLGFPSGGDGDFLILSTGNARHVTTWQNTGDSQGTDLGPVGAAGDEVSVSFTLPVPVVGVAQRLKLDFMFLTEEYPEFLGSGFNDKFEVFINGVNYAVDDAGTPVEVDNAYFTGQAAPGTYFDGRTHKLTLTYAVSPGELSLDVMLRLTDVGDGVVDSAVLVDNVRFERPQAVYLDFDGSVIADLFGRGTSVEIPAFKPEDLGSNATVEELISQIIAKLQDKFAAYDVQFTVAPPSASQFVTLAIGGSSQLAVDISNASPLVQNDHSGASVSVGALLGTGPILGYAGPPDVGNLDRNDKAVVFSEEFAGFFAGSTPEERLEHLVVTIAHELGHNLGLRHVDDSNVDDIMKQTAPRGIGAVFGQSLVTLAEEWSDGVTLQNDHAYLTSILGKANGTGLVASIVQTAAGFSVSGRTFFDATFTIRGSDPDAAPILFHFDTFDGTQNIPLANLPLGATISVVGSTRAGGPPDLFSGMPLAGELTSAASEVPLFGPNGELLPIPLAKGTPGHLVAAGSLTLAENDLGAASLLPNKRGTFTDSDGDTYTIRLTGPGILSYVPNGAGGVSGIALDDTTVGESILSITVRKARGGDGRVNLDGITGTSGAGLRSLIAPAVNLDGAGLVFSGALANLLLGNLSGGAAILAGPGDGIKTNITVRDIGDGTDVALGTEIGTLKALRIGDAGVTATALAKVVVNGDIAGRINVAGLLGSVQAGNLLGGAHIEAGGTALDNTSLAFREIADGSSVRLESVVKALRATRIGAAVLTAQQFDSIVVTGDSRLRVTGDFGAELDAIGRIGRLIARDVLGSADIEAGGLATDQSVFRVRDVRDGASVRVESSILLLQAARIGAVTIEAAAVGTLRVTGDARTGLSGDLGALLTLRGGEDFFDNQLKNAVIAGDVTGAAIVLDSIGILRARSLANTTVFAGFIPTDAQSPLDGGAFSDGGGIGAIVLRAGGIANSVVASRTIGTFIAAGVTTANGGVAFGLLTDVAPRTVSVPGLTYCATEPADHSAGDFHVRVV
jgi:hypothetical protein